MYNYLIEVFLHDDVVVALTIHIYDINVETIYYIDVNNDIQMFWAFDLAKKFDSINTKYILDNIFCIEYSGTLNYKIDFSDMVNNLNYKLK